MKPAWKQFWKRAISLTLVISMALSLCMTTSLAADDSEGGSGAESDYVYMLSCAEEAHVHDESCYVTVCGEEDNPYHTHGQSCYDPNTVCGKSEHIHTLACYEPSEEMYSYEEVKDAITPLLVYCGEEGHTHSFLCATPFEPVTEQAPPEDGDANQPDQPTEGEEGDGDVTQPDQPAEGDEGDDDATQPDQPTEGEGDKNDADQPNQPTEGDEGKDDANQPDQPIEGEGEDTNTPAEDNPVTIPDETVPLIGFPTIYYDYCTVATVAENENVHIHGEECAVEIWAAIPPESDESALVFPTDPVARIGDVEYPMLALAVKKAAPGDTITLIADVTESVTATQSVTIDLDGHTWTGRNDTTLIVNGANDVAVTVKNGTMKAADGFDSSSAGAVIHAEKCDLTIENCKFDGAVKRLVQVAATSGQTHPNVVLTIKDSSFSNATYAAVYAAANGNIKGRSMKVDVSNTTFTSNVRGLYFDVDNSGSNTVFNATVTGSSFTGCTGNAIYARDRARVDGFKLDVKDTTFTENAATVLSAQSAQVTVTGGKISGNTSGSNPVVSISKESSSGSSCSFAMDGTEVSGNTGNSIIQVDSAKTVSIKNATVSGNTATQGADFGGGGLIRILKTQTSIDVEKSVFTGNTAKVCGGALRISGSTVPVAINGCTFSGNTSGTVGGAIHLENKGDTTISDTTITDNTANGKPTKTMGYGNYGGGLYVANTTGSVTLNGSTRIYNNHTPNDKQIPGTEYRGSADIVLYSTAVTSSSTAKDPGKFTRATLNLNCESSFTGEDGVKYTLTQFDRKLVSSNGYYYISGSNYYWPMGYYTVSEEPTHIYLGTAGQHSGEKTVMTTTLADAINAAKENQQDKVYVCNNITIDAANEGILNNSDITFVRCSEHPSGHMFTISGDVTLNGAHIDGMSVAGDASMIYVPSSGHLTIAGSTVIENGKNAATGDAGDGGAIRLSQAGLTMTGGTITNNSARQGGGIYAFSNVNGAKLVFEGGEISNNTATGGNGGGGAYIWAISSEFGVNGGRTTFDGNSANQLGGGVYITNGVNANTHHYIYRATFTNNRSNRFMAYYDGGAIYIDSSTTVEMHNVFISGNSTKRNSQPESAFGVCPTGSVLILDTSGLLVADNSGHDIGMNSATIPLGPYHNPANPDAVLKVSKYALGGGQVSYERGGVPLSEEDYEKGFTDSVMLDTVASDQTVRWAREAAEKNGVVVTGNYADQYGSGIMTNGLLIIGTDRIDMDVEKHWVTASLTEMVGNEENLPAQVIVNLVRMNEDGTFELVEEGTRPDARVTLNRKNNWSYTWKDLDPMAKWSVAEASVEGWKLWKVTEGGTYIPAGKDSMTVPLATVGTTTSEPGKYGHVQESWLGKIAITALFAGTDSVFEGFNDRNPQPVGKDSYYLWVGNGGSYEVTAIADSIEELIPKIPQLTEDEIKQLGSFATLEDENGDLTGYIVSIQKGNGLPSIFVRWEIHGGLFKCGTIANMLSTVITNRESNDNKAISFKKAAYGLAEGKEFTFDVKITIDSKNLDAISGNTFIWYTVHSEGSEPDNANPIPVDKETGKDFYEFSVAIKAGDTVTIHGLQKDDKYEITEKDGDYLKYELVVDEQTNEQRLTDGQKLSGTVENWENPLKEVGTFVNVRKVDLKVQKNVPYGTDEDRAKEFNFTIKLTDKDGEIFPYESLKNQSFEYAKNKKGVQTSTGNFTFENGTETFTLAHNESIVIKGLPAGLTAMITETPVDGMQAMVEYPAGEFLETNVVGVQLPIESTDSEVEVTFQNTRQISALIAGTKVLDGRGFMPGDFFTFTISKCGEPEKNDDGEYKYDTPSPVYEKVMLHPLASDDEIKALNEAEKGSVLHMNGDTFQFEIGTKKDDGTIENGFTKPGRYHYVIMEELSHGENAIPGVSDNTIMLLSRLQHRRTPRAGS